MNIDEMIAALEGVENDTKAKFSFSAGILLYGRIKRFIEMLNASGTRITARVSRGWFQRDWIVSGTASDLRSFARWLKCLDT